MLLVSRGAIFPNAATEEFKEDLGKPKRASWYGGFWECLIRLTNQLLHAPVME